MSLTPSLISRHPAVTPHPSPEEAAKVYDAAARHIRGTSAVCNFPNDFSVPCPDLTVLAAGKRKGSGAGAQAAAACGGG